MSISTSAWAWDRVKNIGAATKLVLMALCEFSNDELVTWRSREEIARRAECSVRAVDRHLAMLESYGLISRFGYYRWCEKAEGPCASRAPHRHRAGTTYRIHMEVGDFDGHTDAPAKVVTREFSSVRTVEEREGSSTVANLASVGEGLESQGKVHSCQFGECEEDSVPQSPFVVVHSRQKWRPFESVNRQDNPQPYPTSPTASPPGDDGGGEVGLGSGDVGVGAGVCVGMDLCDAEMVSQGEFLTPQGASNTLDPKVEARERLAVDALEPKVEAEPELCAAQAALLAECLPEPMQVLDTRGAQNVARLLAERVDAGWTPAQIRQLIDGNIPPRIRRMSAFVAFRLKDCVSPDHSPAALRKRASGQVAGTGERRKAVRVQADAAPERELDPVWEEMFARVRSDLPDAGWVAWTWETHQRLNAGVRSAS